ncbi:MAG TPA: ATPase, T2SS/T4P/T4SS family [Pirellulales bacterium]|jgi:type II secretory ATPase GspE/PulE/Tfp pilus assembly ATPase PilB-like protein|nr:ATPase, T2SS/T4P/T4SS family [Pirellulales bacterium]
MMWPFDRYSARRGAEQPCRTRAGWDGAEDRGFACAEDRGFTCAEDRGFAGAEDRGFACAEDRGFACAEDRGVAGAEDRGADPNRHEPSRPAAGAARHARARIVAVLFGLAAWCCGASAWATDSAAWPNPSQPFYRGPGEYLSPVKIGLFVVLFWIWIKSTEWINEDCIAIRWRYRIWCPIVVFTFFAATLLLFLLPSFVAAYGLLLVSWIAPLATYIVLRNRRVEEHERVLTRDHLRHLLADRSKLFGVKVAEKKKLPQDAGPAVSMLPVGGVNDGANQATLILARQSPGFVPVKEFIAEAIGRRAEAIQFESSATQVVLQHQIDGVLQSAPAHERVRASNALAALSTLAGLNGKDRKQPLSGRFHVEFEGEKYDGRFLTQPTATGEKAVLRLLDKKLRFNKLEEIGLRTKLEEQLLEVYNRPAGFILFSALAGNGLTTTIDVFLKTRDRYMREHAAVEDQDRREREIENVHATLYDSSKKESPATVLPKLVRTYPNVIVAREIPDLETLKILCQQPADERLVLGAVRAKDCTEAMLRMLMLKIPAKEFAAALTAVVNQRLIRKLCDKCKSSYVPTAELLKQLGLPEGRVSTMYNATVYQPPLAGQKSKLKPCEQCGGSGYFGRTAIFELLVVNAAVREALVKAPKPEIIKATARKAGMRTLQEEGILLAARGVVSIQELQRVLKQ